VFGLAAAIVGGHATADDVAQEAFVRAWRYAGSYDQIRTALRRLPWEQATGVLATFYGLSTREIAEHQRVPLGTAKTRIRLGLARLRDHVDASAA
jgi:DNA-directed RNA polymerase specialized sigma24 family protein